MKNMKNMKTKRLLVALLVTSLAVVSYGPQAGAATKATRIKYVINGNLGDKSFFDSAQAGLEKVSATMGYTLKTVQLGSDRTTWQSGFQDAAETDDYDIFVSGTYDTIEYVGKLAPQYPTKKFWQFDSPVDYSGANGVCSNKCSNVYSIAFKQNEGAYLAGFLSAKAVAAKSLPGATKRTKVGLIGSVPIPVINDFVIGFKAGYLAGGGKSSNLLTQFIGGNQPFADPAKAKEIANTMYSKGAAIVWPVAGGSAFGVFEAAAENKAYTLGIDSDQTITLPKANQKATIITSILKNVGAALIDTAKKENAGKVPYGTAVNLGLAEGTVGYVDNAQFKKLISESIRKSVAQLAKKVASGSIKVPSAF